MKPKRVNSARWLEVAAKVLATQGPDALTIDAMCRRMRKTKGSFYAHFESQEAFLAALVAHWRAIHTEEVKQCVDRSPSGQDRLTALNRIAVRIDGRLDQGMRRLAERYPALAPAVAGVDEERVAYLAGLYKTTHGFSARESRDWAMVEYAVYVGLQQIAPRRKPAEWERIYAMFAKRISGPAGSHT